MQDSSCVQSQLPQVDGSTPATNAANSHLLALHQWLLCLCFGSRQDRLPRILQVSVGLGILVGLFVVAANIFGGFLMANDRKSGYWLAVVAAFAPFALRYWALSDLEGLTGGSVSLWDKFTGGDTIGFIFEAALCALLLHPQSREHQRLWFR